MTNLDYVREETEARGCSKIQANSKVVAIVMDIMANTDRNYTELDEAQREREKAKREAKQIIGEAKKKEKEAIELTEKLENGLAVQQKALQETADYIEKFNKSLMECETAEERDNMRKIQLFVNLVDRRTTSENTAFIMGLAAIISGEKIGMLDDIRKIN